MDEAIGILISLQNCDSAIHEIQIKKAEGPERIQKLKQSLTEQETRLSQALELLETRKRERRESERQIEESEAKIDRSNQKLGSIKSNKEYRAALKEVKDLEDAKARLEDQAIEIMEAIENLGKTCEAAGLENDAAKQDFEAASEKVLAELEVLDRELEEQLQLRARLCEAADRKLLKDYDVLRKSKGGIAISPVIKGICQTCHLRIPPQKFNELIRGERMMNCPHCRRIIYWGEDKKLTESRQEDKTGMSE